MNAHLASPQTLGGKAPALCAWMSRELDAGTVDLLGAQLLAGGAIQENWRLQVQLAQGPKAGRHDWVLRRDRATQVGEGRSRSEEFAVLRAAHAAGVTVPLPLLACADESVLGSEFFLMEWVAGVSAAHRLVKDDALVPDRSLLARELGVQMARIHSVRPPAQALPFLGAPPCDPGCAALAGLRLRLDSLPQAFPAIEWGLRALLQRAPEPQPATLVHRDYRTGNYLVHGGRPVAILDWEFSGWGDPREDIGWFFAKCWRFGKVERRAGGIGHDADFMAGYEHTAQRPVDRDSIAWWELLAHVRWAVIAAEQAQRHLSGSESSLELALTGRLISQLEAEILLLSQVEAA